MVGGLTLCLGADEAGRRVAEGAQDGSDGQAQVLVAGVQGHRGKAVGQLRGFLWTDLHMRDLKGAGRRIIRVRRKQRQLEGFSFRPLFMWATKRKIEKND